jgi:hypothetical protein
VVDFPLCHNYHILSNVIIVMVLFDHLLADGLHVGQVPEDGQTDLLVAEDAPVGDFDGGL